MRVPAAGFTANLLIQDRDVLLAGISTEIASIIDPDVVVTPVANWYFNIVSVFVLMLAGALITDRIIAPKFAGRESEVEIEVVPEAGIAALIFLARLIAAIAWPGSALQNPAGGLVPSPFLSGIVPIIFAFFVTVALAYGITVGAIRSTKDVVDRMMTSIADMAPYIVLVFAAAQFIAWFNWSNPGTWLAINGAEPLVHINFTGFALLLAYSCLSAVLESAKWVLEAPIFVPLKTRKPAR